MNHALAELPVTERRGQPSVAVPLRLTQLADDRRAHLSRMAALMGAISLK